MILLWKLELRANCGRGEVVLTPFMGVGSECYGALINGRKAIGIELKPSYYKQSVRNMEAIDYTSLEDADMFAGAEE